MSINSLYAYFLYVSIVAAFVEILFNFLRSVEAKGEIHLFPYGERKLFIEELKGSSDVAYDLFKIRLEENKRKDFIVVALLGIIPLVLITLGSELMPFDITIIGARGLIFNYYIFEYVVLNYLILFFILYVPFKFLSKIWHINEELDEGKEHSKIDEDKIERRQIRLYHYIKYFRSVSGLSIIGFFVQLIFVVNTPYFYFQTNLTIALVPFVLFFIFVFLVTVFGRLRLRLMYEAEDIFLSRLVSLPEAHRRILLKTSKKGLFPNRPQICSFEEIATKLKVRYEWEGETFKSYVKWKDVISFGFLDVESLENSD